MLPFLSTMSLSLSLLPSLTLTPSTTSWCLRPLIPRRTSLSVARVAPSILPLSTLFLPGLASLRWNKAGVGILPAGSAMGTIVRRCLRSLSAISTLPWAARHGVDGLQKNWIARMVGGKSGSEIGPGKVHVALAKQIPSQSSSRPFPPQ